MISYSQNIAPFDLERFYLDMKETVSHSVYFIQAAGPRPENLRPVFAAQELNRKCGDSITLEAYCAPNQPLEQKDFLEKCASLYYSGSFCAVCHFSAELLCQAHQVAASGQQSQPLAERGQHASYSLESLAQDAIGIFSNPSDALQFFSKQELSYTQKNLLRLSHGLMKMPSRVACASLPWRAALRLTEIMPKNRNIPE